MSTWQSWHGLIFLPPESYRSQKLNQTIETLFEDFPETDNCFWEKDKLHISCGDTYPEKSAVHFKELLTEIGKECTEASVIQYKTEEEDIIYFGIGPTQELIDKEVSEIYKEVILELVEKYIIPTDVEDLVDRMYDITTRKAK